MNEFSLPNFKLQQSTTGEISSLRSRPEFSRPVEFPANSSFAESPRAAKHFLLDHLGIGSVSQMGKFVEDFNGNHLGNVGTCTLYEVVTFPQEPSTPFMFAFFLQNNHPACPGAWFNGIYINSRFSKENRNTFLVTSAANGVRENGKMHRIAAAIKPASVEFHDSPK